ncbi:hypothetical protein JIG36_02590 [Actinoplanes sp. LDG1-06]|uniref:Lipoprotein n=1 Tax=Paractinoplanes ovalisporus TaxID=2810368 RepID=A0ABS2A3L6_9ACTN|nr:hypothetical protein [Actinoplanes ovalisporus]MBM2614446.1 hypothetical protein [Actinoplanes ovalisporus]
MRFTRGTLILSTTAAVALFATSGCGPADKSAGAAPGPSATTAKAGTGFGGSPETSTPPAPTKSPEKTEAPEPVATKIKKPVPAWKDVVKPCPYEGQEPEIQKVVKKDATKDGVPDTLVVRSCEATTSYWASTIEVFDGTADPSRPKRIGTLLSDVFKKDQPVVTEVLLNKGIVGVKAYGTSEKAARACPDLILFYRYEFNGSGFDRIWRDAGVKQECRL